MVIAVFGVVGPSLPSGRVNLSKQDCNSKELGRAPLIFCVRMSESIQFQHLHPNHDVQRRYRSSYRLQEIPFISAFVTVICELMDKVNAIGEFGIPVFLRHCRVPKSTEAVVVGDGIESRRRCTHFFFDEIESEFIV